MAPFAFSGITHTNLEASRRCRTTSLALQASEVEHLDARSLLAFRHSFYRPAPMCILMHAPSSIHHLPRRPTRASAKFCRVLFPCDDFVNSPFQTSNALAER